MSPIWGGAPSQKKNTRACGHNSQKFAKPDVSQPINTGSSLKMSSIWDSNHITKKSSPCAVITSAAHSQELVDPHRSAVQSDSGHAMGVHAVMKKRYHPDEEFASVQSLIEEWESREEEEEGGKSEIKPILRRRSAEFQRKLQV